MTDQNGNQLTKVSDALRYTATNITELMTQIANHIDKLEEENVQLKNRIAELESK